MFLAEIAEILRADWLQKSAPDAPVEHLLIDSRQVSDPAASLFFALVGKRNDGHNHLPELYRAGVRHFVVSQRVALKNLPEANILLVENTLDALQNLAAFHRTSFGKNDSKLETRNSKPLVIGITGSNGKTIVKEWLAQLLSADFALIRSPKSYNSQVGVPLSVWQMQPQHTLAIFEAGISQPGEMVRLARIIRPDIGIFTNIGPAHREGFESKAAKIAEKMRLFNEARTLIFCADHEPIRLAADDWQRSIGSERRVFSWSKEGRPADLQIVEIQPLDSGGARLECRLSEQFPIFNFQFQTPNFQVEIPFSDPASIENACHCLATVLCLADARRLAVSPSRPLTLSPSHLLAFSHLEPVAMRLELKAAINRCTLINDAYNNDLTSLRLAMNFAAAQGRGKRLTLVLSDILQSGQLPTVLYEKVAAAMLERGFGRLIGIGTEIPVLREHLPPGFRCDFYPTTDEFLQKIQSQDFADELILLKGARPFAFERVARRLEQKAHKTVLEVNLSALIHNLNVYARLLRPGVKMLAMVKASGYGSGAAEVAKLLEYHKVDYLGVAYADEGIELRQAGVSLPILVLNPEPTSFDAMLRYRLEPEIYAPDLLAELAQFAGREREIAIHLKLDTGMHRLGFEPQHLPALLETLLEHPNLRVKSVFSHLAASDSPVHDDFTQHQAAQFSAMFEPIRAALGYAPLRHIVNTGGIARFPQFHFDMVRLGIGLYGIDSSGLQDQLRVVNTLKATISQIKEIPPGDTVGYNRTAYIERPTRTATISIGYADGLLRLAGNGRYSVLIHGQLAPTVGRVCMDMTMVDVTHIPPARAGDEVIVFGESLPVQKLAESLQTIAYEVFTNISERVKRVYFQE